MRHHPAHTRRLRLTRYPLLRPPRRLLVLIAARELAADAVIEARHQRMPSSHPRHSGGTPPPGAISYAADETTRWFVRYGSEATGSYFELLDGVVTLAVLGTPTLPAHVLDSPPVGEW